MDDNAHARRNCLIGKMVIKKAINLEAMKTVLQEVWKLASGMVIKEWVTKCSGSNLKTLLKRIEF